MKQFQILLASVLLTLCMTAAFSQDDHPIVKPLENPISEKYLAEQLAQKTPRLILTPEKLAIIKDKLELDPVVKNYFSALQLNVDMIMQQPLLTRNQIGRRLLATSRAMLYRMGILGMVYNLSPNVTILDRIEQELLAVCGFSDWNPSHFLDVAEMSLALALAIDWVGNDLPGSTVELVKQNLVAKGIMTSYKADGSGPNWLKRDNNWNQVCHAGMIAASIAVAEDYPELAAKTIHRSIDGIPYGLSAYGPDGAYPEGSTYWGYGTSFSVMTSSMLQSAFGSDFGLAEYPAFLESADFRLLANTPSGMYYNYADCGDRRSENADIILAWFADHTGNANYFERERLLMDPTKMGELSRIHGPALTWIASFEQTKDIPLPKAWKSDGPNPIVIFQGSDDDSHGYYLGAKGGRGTVNHGNMDGGSFIFELKGVRWVIDPGNQKYHDLEKVGFSLWGNCQECERWTLLTKNNFGHSTLTVNDALHVTDGMASITSYSDGEEPSTTIDLSAAFGDNLTSALRTFTKDGTQSLLIEDRIIPSDSTESITWQLLTTADVQLTDGGAILRQEGQSLTLEQLSHPELSISIIMLDPPPLELDRKIDGLKRLELRVPAYLLEQGENLISVRLSGE